MALQCWSIGRTNFLPSPMDELAAILTGKTGVWTPSGVNIARPIELCLTGKNSDCMKWLSAISSRFRGMFRLRRLQRHNVPSLSM